MTDKRPDRVLSGIYTRALRGLPAWLNALVVSVIWGCGVTAVFFIKVHSFWPVFLALSIVSMWLASVVYLRFWLGVRLSRPIRGQLGARDPAP